MPAKAVLKSREKKFRLLFEEHPQPMGLFDPVTGRIAVANRALCALYGFTSQELSAMTLAELQAPGETGRHRIKSGGVIDVELATYAVTIEGNKLELTVVTDITARRHLEDQLRQSQKMEAVGMLAGGVAHDFNNLLTIISGYSQLILNSLQPSDPNYYSAEQILKAGERAATLTAQLLSFSRPQLLQPKVLDLNKLVTGLSAMLRRLIGEDVDLQLVLRPDLGMVSADPGQIEQVVMNLVVNARDAMPKGGTLTIETANVELDKTYAGRHLAVTPGPYAQIAVSDTGGGMDEATPARLFRSEE